ncbi:MAG: hypothetical protein IPJ37_00705 [Bacteroidales bacterium]|nr:hypothetical protein [Bacteroidales bacterium]
MKRDIPPFTRTSVSNVRIDGGTNGPVWESIKISADLPGCEQGIENLPKGIDLEIRLYRNVKKVEFKYLARKLIITDPEALYVAFPFSLPDSRIVFETIGGVLAGVSSCLVHLPTGMLPRILCLSAGRKDRLLS